MSYDRIVISSGHGKYVRGASCLPDGLDEVDEARKVVERVADELRDLVEVVTYHDDVSKTQDENLNRIVDYHNSQTRDLDVSIHFNAAQPTEQPRGCEVFYCTQAALAGEMSRAIAEAGDLIDRGPKVGDFFFLNNTEAPAILIEVCFVDSSADANCYRSKFGEICCAIAEVLSDNREEEIDAIEPPPSSEETVMGTCSWFGGPDDEGVSPSEGLAFIYEITEENQFLFLPFQPEGTTGLARRLNPAVAYFAMRFDYSIHPKDTLLEKRALIRNIKTGVALKGVPADWGPHEEKTGRIIDLSPSLMENLGLTTDDVVEVIFPYEDDV